MINVNRWLQMRYLTMVASEGLEYPRSTHIELMSDDAQDRISIIVGVKGKSGSGINFLVTPVMEDDGLVLMCAWGPQLWHIGNGGPSLYRIDNRDIHINNRLYDEIVEWIGKLGGN